MSDLEKDLLETKLNFKKHGHWSFGFMIGHSYDYLFETALYMGYNCVAYLLGDVMRDKTYKKLDEAVDLALRLSKLKAFK